MLLVDTILYGLLAAWLDNIIPTEYGTKRMPWFFLLPSYWFGSNHYQVTFMVNLKNTVSFFQIRQSTLLPLDVNEDIEETPTDLLGKEAVVIRNIKKTFKGIGKTTVKAVEVFQSIGYSHILFSMISY